MKRVNVLFIAFAYLIAILFCITCWAVPFDRIFNTNEIVVLSSELGKIDEQKDFGALVNARFNSQNNTVEYYLLNAIKLKSVAAMIVEPQYVYLGGDVLGFVYKTNGVLVIGTNPIVDNSHTVEDAKQNELHTGDILRAINSNPMSSISDIPAVLNTGSEGKNDVTIHGIREGEKFSIKATPRYDDLTKTYKLGIWVKDSMSGLGTLTYIVPENNKFGALGHALTDSSTGSAIDVAKGYVYNCDILGIKRASRGVPGEIRGVLRANKSQGELESNTECGLIGYFDQSSQSLKNRKLIQVGGHNTAVAGEAEIYTCLDGSNIRPYKIEIIKTNYQSASNKKSLVFKVTDKRLIDTTGGIVQGMSGSPIVQNGKLIGAVTHVFVNDATKGFGIFVENMLAQ